MEIVAGQRGPFTLEIIIVSSVVLNIDRVGSFIAISYLIMTSTTKLAFQKVFCVIIYFSFIYKY